MDDIQGTCGSYDLTALPDLVSLPLSKPKQTSLESTKHFSEKDGWELCAQELTSDSTVSKDTWKFDEDFHNAADKQQYHNMLEKLYNILIFFHQQIF